MYIIGGWGDSNVKMDCLDMNTMTWMNCPDLLQGLVYPVVGHVGHYIYVMFSTYIVNELTPRGISLQCFDTIASTWSFKASMPFSETIGASTVTVNHRMFVIGGWGNICLNYDPREDTWTQLTSTCNIHFNGATLYLKGKIIICGGMDKTDQSTDTIEGYDLTADTWEAIMAFMALLR